MTRMVISSSSVGDAALAQQRATARSRSASGGSSSVAGRCAPRAGRRGCGSSCRLLARRGSPARAAIRRAILSGGRTAQARPGFEHRARHSPHRAAGLVLGEDRAAAGDQPRRRLRRRRGPCRSGPRRARRRRRPRRPRRASDRPTAGSRSPTGAVGQADDRRARRSASTVRCASPGAMMMRSGSSAHAVLGDQRLALRGDRRAGARTRA